jgi:hypothetical protein
LKGEKTVDCFEKLFDAVKGRQISQDFAFKLICEPDLSGRIKNSRAVTFNCFRHVNPDSYNYLRTGWWSTADNDDKKASNRAWNSTLGPDASHVRRSVAGLTGTSDAGTWRGNDNAPDYDTVGGMALVWVPDAGHPDGGSYMPSEGEADNSNSLISPFRFPYHKEIMYSRINRQVLENYGFSLNPLRLSGDVNWADGVTASLPHQNFIPTSFPLGAYSSPSSWLMNRGFWCQWCWW